MHRIGLRSKRRHKPMPLEQGYDVGGFEAASCSESLFVARQWLPVTDRHTSTIAGSRLLIWLQRRDAGGMYSVNRVFRRSYVALVRS